MKMNQKHRWLTLFITSLFLFLVAGCTSNSTTIPSVVTIGRISGIAYSPDGSTLYVATPGNFLIHQAKGWLPPTNRFALSGLAVTANTMYVSGAKDGQADPFGIAKLIDNETSLNPFAFDGMNVQKMATSYRMGTLYAYSAPEIKSPAAGLHYTTDDGKTWKKALLEGMTDPVTALAANAEDERLVAFGTTQAVYFSEDHGDSIQSGLNNFQDVTALAFDITNDNLLFVGTGGQHPAVYQVGNYDQINSSIKGGFQDYPALFTLPAGDDVTGIAANQQNDKIAIATQYNEVYEFDRHTHTLVNLLKNGKVPITKS